MSQIEYTCEFCKNVFQRDSNKKKVKFCCKLCQTNYFKQPEIKKSINEKINKTFLEKYGCLPHERSRQVIKERSGVDHPLQEKASLKKQKETMLNKYGKEYALQVKDLYTKKEKTCIEKYGEDYCERFGELSSNAIFEKYGVENAFQLPDWKEKSSKTSLINYGVSWSSKSQEVKEKTKITMMEKYGVEHCSYNKETVEKRKQTNLRRYGVTNKLMLYKYNNISKFQMSVYEKVKNKKSEALLEVYNKETKFSFDILIPSEKLIIECHGDYWHCNPLKYKSDYYIKRKQMTAQEVWDKDKKRKEKLESIGYKVVIVWEHDWNIDPNIDRYV